MNAITQLDLLLVEETVASYDIGELVRYWPATPGSENRSYFLRTMREGCEHDYTLTIIHQTAIARVPYVALLDACEHAGLPVASIIRNREGNPYDKLDGKAVVLAPRLPGRHVYNPTVKQVQALARFMGRFHIATDNVRIPPYPRVKHWLQQRFDLVRTGIGYGRNDLLADTITQVCSMLERHDVSELPTGVIHTDLFRNNVLFNERGLTGVLDLHRSAEGYLIYDLAVAAIDWCNDGNGILDPERTLALLRSYQQVRPLTRQELWFFPGFTLYAALVLWLSRLSSSHDPHMAPDARFSNPEELQRIVEQHSAHFFYLDERLLV